MSAQSCTLGGSFFLRGWGNAINAVSMCMSSFACGFARPWVCRTARMMELLPM
jgi:hypothetical protein